MTSDELCIQDPFVLTPTDHGADFEDDHAGEVDPFDRRDPQ